MNPLDSIQHQTSIPALFCNWPNIRLTLAITLSCLLTFLPLTFILFRALKFWSYRVIALWLFKSLAKLVLFSTQLSYCVFKSLLFKVLLRYTSSDLVVFIIHEKSENADLYTLPHILTSSQVHPKRKGRGVNSHIFSRALISNALDETWWNFIETKSHCFQKQLLFQKRGVYTSHPLLY